MTEQLTGRALDAAFAREVLGWEHCGGEEWITPGAEVSITLPAFHESWDAHRDWTMAKLWRRGFMVRLQATFECFAVRIERWDDGLGGFEELASVEAANLATALCLACIEAVRGTK